MMADFDRQQVRAVDNLKPGPSGPEVPRKPDGSVDLERMVPAAQRAIQDAIGEGKGALQPVTR